MGASTPDTTQDVVFHLAKGAALPWPLALFAIRGGLLSSISPRKFLLAISAATMARMSTLVVLLRTSDRKLAFYAAIALKATELINML